MNMRIHEFIPEAWWDDLPSGSLTMMGYEDPQGEAEDAPQDLSHDIKNLRRQAKGLKAA
jgi:hypothetical protein